MQKPGKVTGSPSQAGKTLDPGPFFNGISLLQTSGPEKATIAVAVSDVSARKTRLGPSEALEKD